MKLDRLNFVKLLNYLNIITKHEFKDKEIETIDKFLNFNLDQCQLESLVKYIANGQINEAVQCFSELADVNITQSNKLIRNKLPSVTNKNIIIEDCKRILKENNMTDAYDLLTSIKDI